MCSQRINPNYLFIPVIISYNKQGSDKKLANKIKSDRINIIMRTYYFSSCARLITYIISGCAMYMSNNSIFVNIKFFICSVTFHLVTYVFFHVNVKIFFSKTLHFIKYSIYINHVSCINS